MTLRDSLTNAVQSSGSACLPPTCVKRSRWVGLSPLQRERLGWIVAFMRDWRRSPRFGEMAAAWGVSRQAAWLTVSKLTRKGYVDRKAPDSCALRLVMVPNDVAVTS